MSAFHNPVRVRFGNGALEDLDPAVGARRCVVLTTEGMAKRGLLGRVESMLGPRVAGRFTGVAPNPTIRACLEAAEALRGAAAEVVVAVGGGSVLDTAKAVAAGRAPGLPAGWLAEHLRAGVPFPAEFRPPAIIAIPTTAGTGSEVTMWATVWDELDGRKRSLSHPALYPEAALLDPRLTHSVPRETTVATAFDALSHAMESIWNRASNPVSDALAARAIGLIPGHLRRVLASPDDPEARAGLLEAALLAGLASSGTRTALAHSISYPLTSELGVPHGLACSLTLAELLRRTHERFPARAGLIAEALGAGSVAAASEAIYRLFRDAGVPALLARRVGSAEKLMSLKTGLIAPGRAENFLLAEDQASAADLLRKAWDELQRP